MLRTDAWDAWLDPTMNDGATATRFAYARAVRDMKAYKVSTYVNQARNQGERCIEPLPDAPHLALDAPPTPTAGDLFSA